MGFLSRALAFLAVKPALTWNLHAPEVEGEEVYVAEHEDLTLWIKREAHETTWTFIVVDYEGDPISLATNLRDKAAAMEAAMAWVGVENV